MPTLSYLQKINMIMMGINTQKKYGIYSVKTSCYYQGILRTLSCSKILTIELCKEGISAVY